MLRSLIAGLVVSGVLLVACTMKAPQDVSQAVPADTKKTPSLNLAAGEPASKPVVAEPAVPPSATPVAKPAVVAKAAFKPEVAVPAKDRDVVVSAAGREVKAEQKPSRFAALASAAGSLPLLSMMRGEDGRISPINMMMKIRSMMPMCAGGNCVTTSSGFQRVPSKEAMGKEPVKPFALVTAG